MPDTYEIVNATQLNNDLLDIADAIRAKSQGQDPLQFPNEFISEINGIIEAPAVTSISAKAAMNIAKNDIVQIYNKPLQPCHAIWSSITAQGRTCCAWSPDGSKLASAFGESPYIKVYDASTVPYSELATPADLPAGAAKGCAWSPDGTRLAVAHNTSPFITVYDTTTTPYTKLTNPGTLPASSGNNCAWSPDGTRLAVAHHTSPFITIYDTTTTPYTKLTNPGTLPTNAGFACTWSHDGNKLYVGQSSGSIIYVYDTTTSPYSLLNENFNYYTGAIRSISIHPESTFIAVAVSPNLTGNFCEIVYVDNLQDAIMLASNKSANVGDVIYGWAKSAISKGSTGQAYRTIYN